MVDQIQEPDEITQIVIELKQFIAKQVHRIADLIDAWDLGDPPENDEH